MLAAIVEVRHEKLFEKNTLTGKSDLRGLKCGFSPGIETQQNITYIVNKSKDCRVSFELK